MIWKTAPHILLAASLTLTLAGAQQGKQSENSNPNFSLTISVDPTAATPTSDVIITIKLQNTSDSVYFLPVKLVYKRADLDGFIPEVSEANGKALSRKHGPEERRRNYSMAVTGIKPGHGFEEKLDLTKLFNLTTPGTYNISVHRIDRKANARVNSNVVTLTVASN